MCYLACYNEYLDLRVLENAVPFRGNLLGTGARLASNRECGSKRVNEDKRIRQLGGGIIGWNKKRTR